jgi:hypothetical protein
MPGSSKTAQAVDAARCLEDSVHASMMTSVPAPRQDDGRGECDRITVVFTHHPSKADPGACPRSCRRPSLRVADDPLEAWRRHLER